jgi:hypothetical protein
VDDGRRKTVEGITQDGRMMASFWLLNANAFGNAQNSPLINS